LEGVTTVENVRYVLDNRFKSGTYQIIGRETTVGLSAKLRMNKITILLKIVDLNEEAAKLEAEKNQPKGGKKK
jgi:hypothetical protein